MPRCSSVTGRAVNPEMIIARVAAAYGVRSADILGRRRSKHISAARRAAGLELLAAGLSLSDAGRALDRDHSTLFYYRERERAQRPPPAEAAEVERADPVVAEWLKECGL